MDFLEALRKDVNSRVLRVLLKRPHNGIKPSDLRSELNLTPSCGTKTRRDGLCVAFNASNFEQKVAEFKSLNEAIFNKYNVNVTKSLVYWPKESLLSILWLPIPCLSKYPAILSSISPQNAAGQRKPHLICFFCT